MADAQPNLMSPTYKLGKRALQVMEDTHAHGMQGGPSLKRSVPFRDLLHPIPGYMGCSPDVAEHPHPHGDKEHEAAGQVPHGAAMQQVPPYSGSWSMPLPMQQQQQPRMAHGKDAATLLQDMHQTPKSKARCPTGAVFSADAAAAVVDVDSQEADDSVTPSATLLYRREQLGLRMGALALNSAPRDSKQHGPHACDSVGPDHMHEGLGEMGGSLTGSPGEHAHQYDSGDVARQAGSATTTCGTLGAACSQPLVVFGVPVQQQAHGEGSSNTTTVSASVAPGVPVSMTGAGMGWVAEGVPMHPAGSTMVLGPSWQQYQAVVEELRAVRDQGRTSARRQRKQLAAQSSELHRLKEQVAALVQGKDDALERLQMVTSEREALRTACEQLTQQLVTARTEQQLLVDKVIGLEATVEAQQDEHDQLSRQLEQQYEVEGRSRRRTTELEMRCSQLKMQLRNQHGMVGHLADQVRQLETREGMAGDVAMDAPVLGPHPMALNF